jgi:type IV pili sensor histidine kinase/response regulator
MFQFFRQRRVASPSVLIICFCVALAGCASNTLESDSSTPTVNARVPRADLGRSGTSPVRYDRYTIVSTKPKPDQLQLLDQVIDLRIPDTLKPSVHQAMTYVLRHSGYQLCAARGDVGLLFTHPLPASHHRLGPISLRNAMQILAGPAWEVRVDELQRRICFAIKPTYQRPSPVIPSDQTIAAPSTTSIAVGGK